jgi:hypothetical protein
VPITITLPGPGTAVGPGYRLELQSSLIGPIPTNSHFQVTIGTDAEGLNPIIRQLIPTTTHDAATIIGRRQEVADEATQTVAQPGATVHVIAELLDGGQVVQDSGAQQVTWDPTTMLWQHANDNVVSGTGSFTAQDRATLDETNQLSLAIQDATQVALPGLPVNTTLPLSDFFAVSPLDRLTTQSLSGGVTCDPVRVDISSSNFTGVQVRIASFPPEWSFRTPDSSWGFHDLAVLTMLRGGQTLKRVGIHTLSFTEQPLPGQLLPWAVGLIGVAIIPRDYQLHVDWAEGVCGELLGLLLP